jgi:hypothetical protein
VSIKDLPSRPSKKKKYDAKFMAEKSSNESHQLSYFNKLQHPQTRREKE